jgi:ABC-type uncharacterized transport system permease subunit
MGFGLVIGFIEYLQIVTTSNHSAIANTQLCNSLQHILSLLSLLCLHYLLPGDGSNNVLCFCAHIPTDWGLSHS